MSLIVPHSLGRDQYVPQDQQAPHPDEPGRGGPIWQENELGK